MRKVISLAFASLLGLLSVCLVNWATSRSHVWGIVLPAGWDGPHYWLTTEAPNEHSSGLPFAMFLYSDHEGAFYSNNLAMGMNVASGVGIGLGAVVAIQKYKGRPKT